MSKSFDPDKLGPIIKIKDISQDTKISRDEMKTVTGGFTAFNPSHSGFGGITRGYSKWDD